MPEVSLVASTLRTIVSLMENLGINSMLLTDPLVIIHILSFLIYRTHDYHRLPTRYQSP